MTSSLHELTEVQATVLFGMHRRLETVVGEIQGVLEKFRAEHDQRVATGLAEIKALTRESEAVVENQRLVAEAGAEAALRAGEERAKSFREVADSRTASFVQLVSNHEARVRVLTEEIERALTGLEIAREDAERVSADAARSASAIAAAAESTERRLAEGMQEFDRRAGGAQAKVEAAAREVLARASDVEAHVRSLTADQAVFERRRRRVITLFAAVAFIEIAAAVALVVLR